jgi:hypothetical protein
MIRELEQASEGRVELPGKRRWVAVGVQVRTTDVRDEE